MQTTTGLELLVASAEAAGCEGAPAAGAAGPTQDGAQHRCLDSTHESWCTRCSAPPAAGREKHYRLMGDPGKKNGEKKLRHLLLCCAEWTGSSAREELASKLEQEGRRDLAELLRLKWSAALRKESMLIFAREWRVPPPARSAARPRRALTRRRGYKSDLWHCSGSRAPSRAPAHPPKPRAPRPPLVGSRSARAAAQPAAPACWPFHADAATAAEPRFFSPTAPAPPLLPVPSLFADAVAERRRALQAAVRRLGAEVAAAWELVAGEHAGLVSLPMPARVDLAGPASADPSPEVCAAAYQAAPVPPRSPDLSEPDVSPAARPPPPQLAPPPPAAAHNATALCVTAWLRSVAQAHGARLAQQHASLSAAAGAPPAAAAEQLDAAALPLLLQAAEFVARAEATLGCARPRCLAPGGAGCASADERARWAAALAAVLDGTLAWLAQLKTASGLQACPRMATACGLATAALTEAFMAGAEEALTWRRQWLLFAPGQEEAAAPGARGGGALATNAVLAAVLDMVARLTPTGGFPGEAMPDARRQHPFVAAA